MHSVPDSETEERNAAQAAKRAQDNTNDQATITFFLSVLTAHFAVCLSRD